MYAAAGACTIFKSGLPLLAAAPWAPQQSSAQLFKVHKVPQTCVCRNADEFLNSFKGDLNLFPIPPYHNFTTSILQQLSPTFSTTLPDFPEEK